MIRPPPRSPFFPPPPLSGSREPPRARADDRGVPPPAARDRAFGAGAPLRAGAVLHLHRLRVLLWDRRAAQYARDRKSTRLNSSHLVISYAVFCLKKKNRRSM